jgi:hypothetical protein
MLLNRATASVEVSAPQQKHLQTRFLYNL